MKTRYLWLFAVLLLVCTACSPLRFLPPDRSLLTNVRLRSTDGQVAPADYRLHIRQEANTRWLSVAKVPLGIY